MALLCAPAALAKEYDLPTLLDLARRNNPGVAANAQATMRVQAQLSEANRSWLPTGEFTSLVAPVPEIRCQNVRNLAGGPDFCVNTNVSEATTKFSGIFTRTEVKLTQPLFTFGKIAAGKNAAEEGVAASRSRETALIADLELNVTKAYYGLKLARSVLETLTEGTGYLEDAQTRVEKELAAGTGNLTQIDRFRLRTIRADLETRLLETQRLAGEAKAGLRALLGSGAPPDIEVDQGDLEPVNVPEKLMPFYEEQARLSRPEVKALDHLVNSKRALADLERRKQYPDLVVMGTAAYAYASSIDNPKNAFLNDPFNTRTPSFGAALAMRLPLDLGVRNARAAQIQSDAIEAEWRRREALGGIIFEVQRAYNNLNEARKRLTVLRTGERASKAWITAVKQNFEAGLAEARDLSDGLNAFFGMRIRVLQSVFDFNNAAAALARATGSPVTVATIANEAGDGEAAPAATPEPAASKPDAKADAKKSDGKK